jgi:hypothetical protein
VAGMGLYGESGIPKISITTATFYGLDLMLQL